MTVSEPIALLTITVFARHTEKCPNRANPQWKRCKCRKSLYIREGGKTRYVSAQTRSWEEAERVAQAERDKRDPVKIKLQKIAEDEAARDAARQAKLKPLGESLEQWLSGMKGPRDTSLEAYRSTVRRINRWAASKGLVNVSDVTPDLLDAWRSSWAENAKDDENRLALTTQAALLTRVKSFFRWATAIGYLDRNPASLLKAITPNDSETMPLTPKQFDEVMESTKLLDADARYKSAKVGVYLRAIFLIQRWTGLRIGDVLQLPKAALVGNRFRLNMQKTGDDMECILPDHVAAELKALPSSKEIHPDYFFWSRNCSVLVNTNKWVRKVRRLNDYLSLKDDDCEVMEFRSHMMEFRSHMLRDTFAVEMLLAGVPLEKVSKLLGHRSIAITERYYAKWAKSRLRQLEGDVIAAMRRMGATVTMDAAMGL